METIPKREIGNYSDLLLTSICWQIKPLIIKPTGILNV